MAIILSETRPNSVDKRYYVEIRQLQRYTEYNADDGRFHVTRVEQDKRITWKEWDAETHTYRCGIIFKNGRKAITGEFTGDKWTHYSLKGAVMDASFKNWYSTFDTPSEFRDSVTFYNPVDIDIDMTQFDYWTGADEMLLQYLKGLYPHMKYWWDCVVGIPGMGWCRVFYILHYMSVPETETGIKIMSKDPKTFSCTWLCPAWLKVTASKRREAINHMLHRDIWTCGRSWESYFMTIEEVEAEDFGWRELSPVRKDYYKQYLKDKAWVLRNEGDQHIELRKGGFPEVMVLYADYLRMRADRGFDIMNDYWRHRKNWKAIHDEDIRAHNEEVQAARLLHENDARAAQDAIIKHKYEKYSDYILEDGNLKAFMSNDVEVWRTQASVLNQCILSARYYSKVKSLIVFVYRDNKPDSTYEINVEKKKIIQEYGVEEWHLTRKQMKPKEDAHALVEKFVATYLM